MGDAMARRKDQPHVTIEQLRGTVKAQPFVPFTLRLPAGPPFVMIADPAEVKQIFTAPPDVLHPGDRIRIGDSDFTFER